MACEGGRYFIPAKEGVYVNYCRLFVCLLLFTMGLLSQPIALVADEPLSVKIELRNGMNGPKKVAVAVPGEHLFMTVYLKGQALEDAKELKLEVWHEIRSDNGELLMPIEKRQATQEKLIGTRQITFSGALPVPDDYEGKTIKHCLFVRDLTTGVEVKDELTITIRRPNTLHLFNAGYYLPNFRDVPTSGSFIVGDKARIWFYAGQIKESKSLDCKLEFVPTNKSKKPGELNQTFEIPRSKREDDRLALRFDFPADEPFEGKVRLTVVDDLKNSDSIELPLSIAEALGSDENAYVAERPGDESKAVKKE